MDKERIDWIDVCKGLGIVLVVLGHTSISTELVRYIFSFHMPLFFFLSGYLFSVNSHPQFLIYIWHKIKTLLVPYCYFSLISIATFSIIVEAKFSIWGALQAFFISKRNCIFYNVPLWFFTCLFLVGIIYYLLKKYLKNNCLIYFVIFAMNSIAILLFKTIEQPKLPWSLDQALYYILFFGTGDIISKMSSNKLLWSKNSTNLLRHVVICFAVCLNLILLVLPDKIDFVYNFINEHKVFEILWFPLAGYAGIVTFIVLAKYLRKSDLFSFLGRNSVIIFALQIPFGLCILDKLNLFLSIQINQAYNIIGVVQTIFILVILKPIIDAINNYFPFILGRKCQ